MHILSNKTVNLIFNPAGVERVSAFFAIAEAIKYHNLLMTSIFSSDKNFQTHSLGNSKK